MDDHSTDLLQFGTDLTSIASTLPRTYGMTELQAQLLGRVEREPRRSIALLGPAGTGKTALVYALVRELKDRGCRVLRISPTDFLAGTRYLGDWQTRVNDLVRAVNGQIKLWRFIERRQRHAETFRLQTRDFRGRHADDGEPAVNAFRQQFHKMSGGRSGAKTDPHAGLHHLDGASSSGTLELVDIHASCGARFLGRSSRYLVVASGNCSSVVRRSRLGEGIPVRSHRI